MSKFISLDVNNSGGIGTPYRVESTRSPAFFIIFGVFNGATIELQWGTELTGAYFPFQLDGVDLISTIPLNGAFIKLPQNLFLRTNLTNPGAGTLISFGYFDT